MSGMQMMAALPMDGEATVTLPMIVWGAILSALTMEQQRVIDDCSDESVCGLHAAIAETVGDIFNTVAQQLAAHPDAELFATGPAVDN